MVQGPYGHEQRHVLGSRPVLASSPADNGGGDSDGRKGDLWASVVAGGEAAPALQAPEHDLDPFASFVATLVVLDGLTTRLSARGAGLSLCLSMLF